MEFVTGATRCFLPWTSPANEVTGIGRGSPRSGNFNCSLIQSAMVVRMATKSRADVVDVYVGSRVRMRRLMLGLTQTRLGDALGITFQQIQKYENGTNRISASRLQRMADTLKVSI